ncbi:MAG: CbtB-domain containing protein [Candidatus Nitrosothermus koennekii]|nr:MAG: CbtB-domain containing protein [Candidatus Nitrosothermus koennekii]
MSKHITIEEFSIPLPAVIVLAAIAAFAIFTMGFDQGHLFSIAEGSKAFDELYLHELFHDMRHAAGFPCH